MHGIDNLIKQSFNLPAVVRFTTHSDDYNKMKLFLANIIVIIAAPANSIARAQIFSSKLQMLSKWCRDENKTL